MNSGNSNTLFGKFEILDVLKKDEHSAVYLAQHLFLGKKIILKTLNTSNLSDGSVLERFKREAKLLARLEHPNIIKVLDFGTAENFFYISFEYFQSRNLRDVIAADELDERTKKNLLLQILKGVHCAHQAQIIHRDIKPENILVDKHFHLKIADFGLALAENDPLITNKSSIVGTPGYMAPEQITGEKLTVQSDLFSIGVVAFELFTGRNPFVKADISSTINTILSFDDTIFEQLSGVPQTEALLIRKALNKKKELRPKSCVEMIESLGETYQAGADPVRGKSMKWLMTAAAAVVLILAGVFFLGRYFTPQSVSTQLKETGNPPAGEQGTTKIKNDGASTENTAQSLPASKTGANNDNTTVPAPTEAAKDIPVISARVSIDCIPWATVYIDSLRIDTTPVDEFRRLSLGRHTIRLVNPDYPPYVTSVVLTASGVIELKTRLDAVFGGLNPQVVPWGEIIINGVNYGETPFKKPIYLSPGKYTVKIKNPSYGEYQAGVTVKKGEITPLKFSFEENAGKQN